MIGFAVAAGLFVRPIRHQGGDTPEKTVINWLKKQTTPNIVVMHNAMYDLGWLLSREVQGRVIDTMVAAPLLNSAGTT